MSITIEDPNDPTKEIEVFTGEELEAQKAAAIAPHQEEVEKYKRISAEKTENFKKLNELTEAEKAQYSAKELENMARVEAAEKKAADLEATITGDKQKRIDSDREKALAKFHGGDETLKKALEDNYKLINMEGDDTDTIFQKAQLAANMYSGATGGRSPLSAGLNGSAPAPREAGRTEEFMKSDKAKAAMAAMGE